MLAKSALRYAMLLLLPFVVSGCLDIVEEIFVHKDGSGIYRYSITMAENDQTQVWLKGKGNAYDTSFTVADLKDRTANSFKYPDIVKKATVRLRAVQPNNGIILTIELPFETAEEIQMLQTDLARYDSTLFAVRSVINIADGKLSHRRVANPFLQEEQFRLIGTHLFEDVTLTTIYHLPKRVRNHNVNGGEVSKKQLTQRLLYLDILKENTPVQQEIVYR